MSVPIGGHRPNQLNVNPLLWMINFTRKVSGGYGFFWFFLCSPMGTRFLTMTRCLMQSINNNSVLFGTAKNKPLHHHQTLIIEIWPEM